MKNFIIDKKISKMTGEIVILIRLKEEGEEKAEGDGTTKKPGKDSPKLEKLTSPESLRNILHVEKYIKNRYNVFYQHCIGEVKYGKRNHRCDQGSRDRRPAGT